MHRNGDEEATIFTSNRVFFCNGGWYFAARELTEIGPFSSRKQVNEALYLYLKTVIKTTIDASEVIDTINLQDVVDFEGIVDLEDIRDFDWSELFPELKFHDPDTYH